MDVTEDRVLAEALGTRNETSDPARLRIHEIAPPGDGKLPGAGQAGGQPGSGNQPLNLAVAGPGDALQTAQPHEPAAYGMHQGTRSVQLVLTALLQLMASRPPGSTDIPNGVRVSFVGEQDRSVCLAAQAAHVWLRVA